MKKINLLLSMLFALAVMSGFGPKSVKGKWTDTDKTVFKTEFEKTLKQSQPTLDAAIITKISDCTIAKIEAEYSIEDITKKENEVKVGEFAASCVTESMPMDTTTPVNDSTTVK